MSGAGVHLEAVTRHYVTPGGIVRALDGVTLDVEPGTSLAIAGPSGCGKSTLLGLMGGLETPTGGRVTVAGHELSGLSDGDRARLRCRAIGFVYQSDNLLPFLTAVENVALQVTLAGGDGDDRRCFDALAGLGLGDAVDKLPDQLSRGQRQRVAVARALVNQPGLILADEPTGSLDADSATRIVDVLRAAQHDAGTTVIVVTHDPGVAMRFDRTIRLRDGRLHEDADA